MEWKDQGLILGVRRHGETSAIVEAMTEQHGRCLGLVRGGRSSRLRPLLQPGNSVSLVWRARLEDHLGTFTVEAETLRAAGLMEMPLGIYGIQTLASHMRLLPERDPHAGLYRAALVLLEHLQDAQTAARLMIRFELALLEELGFGLDLSCCAGTGTTSDLAYVSPRSGRAVSRQAGAPYADRLLLLPSFLLPREMRPGAPSGEEREAGEAGKAGKAGKAREVAALRGGFDLAAFFLDRHVYSVRGITPPEARAGFIRRIGERIIAAGETGAQPQRMIEQEPHG